MDVSKPVLIVLLMALTTMCCGISRSLADEPLDFAADVLPVLQRSCFRCHEGRDAESGIRLDQRSVVFGQGDSEPLVVPGDSGRSRLIEVVSQGDADLVMPPEGPRLNRNDIETLRRWVDEGAVWESAELGDADVRQHWAFQPIRRPPLPDIDGPGGPTPAPWNDNPIDAFVARRHQRRGLQPAELADPRTLVRRLYLDLHGLPPTYQQAVAYQNDLTLENWQRLVDAALASPQYGQRWGRHWLDVARWAESEGYESNHPRSSAWRYRDWVIDSFNQDQPFDQFVRQQIAGDEIPEYGDDHLIATGFLASARISSNEEDKWLQRNDVYVDIVNAVGSAFLGLTIQCAQCHDHRFDPISIRDYYQLQAFFSRGQPVDMLLKDDDGQGDDDRFSQLLRQKREIYEEARQRFIEQRTQQLSEPEQAALQTPPRQRSNEQELLARQADLQFQVSSGTIEKHIPQEQRQQYKELTEEVDRLMATVKRAYVFYSPVTSPHPLDVVPSPGFYPLPFDADYFRSQQPYIKLRGNVHSIGAVVQPGWPDVLSQLTGPMATLTDGHSADVQREPSTHESEPGTSERTRWQLAQWLTDRNNPLVARVWVNRLWHCHFGRGLVSTVDDFGLRGARPTHPQLLDWLACELIDSGWSTKHIQRLILTSRTYRLASAATASARQRDPQNAYLTRWTPRRLEFEVLRDSMLAVSGELDLQAEGASVPEDQRETSRRRSIFLFQRRDRPAEMQGLFDGPNECSASCGTRLTSTTPLQSLYLLNSEFSAARANHLARQIQDAHGDRAQDWVDAAFRQILQRDPRPGERVVSIELLEELRRQQPDHSDAMNSMTPLAILCQSLMNLNEFAYVE